MGSPSTIPTPVVNSPATVSTSHIGMWIHRPVEVRREREVERDLLELLRGEPAAYVRAGAKKAT